MIVACAPTVTEAGDDGYEYERCTLHGSSWRAGTDMCHGCAIAEQIRCRICLEIVGLPCDDEAPPWAERHAQMAWAHLATHGEVGTDGADEMALFEVAS